MNYDLHMRVQMLCERVLTAHHQDERGKLSLKHAIEMLEIMKEITIQLPHEGDEQV